MLELLVIVLILGVLLTLGVVGYGTINNNMTARGEAEQLRSLIRDSATLAASRSLDLKISLEGKVVYLRDQKTNDVLRQFSLSKIGVPDLDATNVIAVNRSGRLTLPAAVVARANTLTVTFNGTGPARNGLLQVSGIGQTRWL